MQIGRAIVVEDGLGAVEAGAGSLREEFRPAIATPALMTLLLMKVRRSIQRVSRGLERIQEQSPREYHCPAGAFQFERGAHPRRVRSPECLDG